MTLQEYIANPMGKNNATFTPLARESIKNNYLNRYNNMMLREKGKMDFYLYKDSKNNCYYAHIKVPSEVVANFYYDTVFKFYTDSGSDTEGGTNLEKYQVRFFSNDPAFVFTHAHTYIEQGLFINELSLRMSKEAVKKKATEKNPADTVGYVKSIYFAYLYMKSRGLFKTVSYGAAQPYNQRLFASYIMPADEKIALRQEEEAKRDKKKKIVVDKQTMRALNSIGISDKSRERLVTTTKKTSSIQKTKAINTVKKIKKK